VPNGKTDPRGGYPLSEEDRKMNKNEETISLEEARGIVELTSKRIALLHLSYARTLVDEFGDEEGRRLILKAVKDYGKKIGERVKEGVVSQGLDPSPENYGAGKAADLPPFGMHERSEKIMEGGVRISRAYGCALAKLWEEYGEEELGRLYCYVDPAKFMAYNPDYKLVHLKALPDGDACCELTVKPTTEKEKEDFQAEDSDWAYIDKG
jgi:hypothetical protein